MMKKLLIFCLVISMAPCVLAIPVLRVDPADAKDNYHPSDLITIQLYDDTRIGVSAFTMDALVDSIAAGIADEPQIFNGLFGYKQPGWLNYDGKLVAYAAASVTSSVGPFPAGVLYSFEYHIPDVPFSTMINISTYNDVGYNDYYYPFMVYYVDGSTYEAPPELGLVIHLVPEPATIALLGLGGLSLLRKRRK